VGPTGANDVANALAGMLDGEKDPAAHIVAGRFVLGDGSYSRWPTGAVAVQLPDPSSSTLTPAGGVIVGAPETAGFGSRAVDANGLFMDYDGQPQATPDITTRGMIVFDSRGCVAARYYLDVFPTLGSPTHPGAVRSQPAVRPAHACPAGNDSNGVAQVQAGAAMQAGLPAPLGTAGASPAGCAHLARPLSTIVRPRGARALRVRVLRERLRPRGRLRLRGRARAFGCGGQPGRVARVTVSILRRNVHRDPARCRFVDASGHLGARRPCSQPVQLLARGTSRWSLGLRLHVPRGRYTVIVRVVDTHGLTEPGGVHADLVRLVVG
jgi:hypothetical protein